MTIRRAQWAVLVLLLEAGCSPATTRPQFFPSSDPAKAALPFSEAAQVGDLLFLSGQIGAAPGTMTVVPGGVTAEARQAMENIKDVLGHHGATMADVVKCTIFLADIADWPAFNAIYRTYFTPPYPARSAFGASGLALGARVEVDCIAAPPHHGRIGR